MTYIRFDLIQSKMMRNSLIQNISKDIQKAGYREFNSELICKDKIQNYGQNSK